MIYAWTLTLTQKSWNISMEQIEAAPIGSSSYGCDVHIRKESLTAKFQFYGAVGDDKCHKDKPLAGTVQKNLPHVLVKSKGTTCKIFAKFFLQDVIQFSRLHEELEIRGTVSDPLGTSPRSFKFFSNSTCTSSDTVSPITLNHVRALIQDGVLLVAHVTWCQ